MDSPGKDASLSSNSRVISYTGDYLSSQSSLAVRAEQFSRMQNESFEDLTSQFFKSELEGEIDVESRVSHLMKAARSFMKESRSLVDYKELWTAKIQERSVFLDLREVLVALIIITDFWILFTSYTIDNPPSARPP